MQTSKVDINVVADYIIIKAKGDDINTPLSNLKLQKLLYYVKVWDIVHNDSPLFDGKFQAWIHGPVNRVIFDRFKNIKTLYSEIEIDNLMYEDATTFLTKSQKNFIDSVLEVYMPYTGSQLESLSHNEAPWIEARKGYSNSQRCEVIIDEKLIKNFYSNLVSLDHV